MLATSHIAATTAILFGANTIGMDVNGGIVVASYVLGVGVDLDHPVFYWKDSVRRTKEYISDRKNFKLGETILHSHLQEPIVVFATFLLSLTIYLFNRNVAVFIPTLCFGAHIFMDSLVDFDNHLLWPYSKKTYRGPYKQNMVIEGIIGSVLSVVFISLLLLQVGII